MREKNISFFAFACNAKSFAIAFHFYLSPSSHSLSCFFYIDRLLYIVGACDQYQRTHQSKSTDILLHQGYSQEKGTVK